MPLFGFVSCEHLLLLALRFTMWSLRVFCSAIPVSSPVAPSVVIGSTCRTSRVKGPVNGHQLQSFNFLLVESPTSFFYYFAWFQHQANWSLLPNHSAFPFQYYPGKC